MEVTLLPVGHWECTGNIIDLSPSLRHPGGMAKPADPGSRRQESCEAYMPPREPGYSIEMKRESLDEFHFPHGPVWAKELQQQRLKAQIEGNGVGGQCRGVMLGSKD